MKKKDYEEHEMKMFNGETMSETKKRVAKLKGDYVITAIEKGKGCQAVITMEDETGKQIQKTVVDFTFYINWVKTCFDMKRNTWDKAKKFMLNTKVNKKDLELTLGLFCKAA